MTYENIDSLYTIEVSGNAPNRELSKYTSDYQCNF